jgi:hypothetical protein
MSETRYDLVPDQEVELKDGGVMTLQVLADRADANWTAVHGRIFRSDSRSFNVLAKVTSPGQLLLWDAATRVSHFWAHLGMQPEVLAPLLKAIAAEQRKRGTGT